MNRFSTKQYHFSNANNHQYINPFRVKRSYMTMLEQDHLMSSPSYIGSKRLKQSDNKTAESLIKYNRPKISEKLKREIELYNYQRTGYSVKIFPCPCENP